MTDRIPRAPKHLSDASRALWRSILATFAFEPHHEQILKLALEAADRAEDARATIERDGAYQTTARGGVTTHPAIAIERDSAIRAARLLRELGLDLDDGRSDGRPPSRWRS